MKNYSDTTFQDFFFFVQKIDLPDEMRNKNFSNDDEWALRYHESKTCTNQRFFSPDSHDHVLRRLQSIPSSNVFIRSEVSTLREKHSDNHTSFIHRINVDSWINSYNIEACSNIAATFVTVIFLGCYNAIVSLPEWSVL